MCGGSASGKTTVANKIIEALDVPWVVLLSMDSFYKVRNKIIIIIIILAVKVHESVQVDLYHAVTQSQFYIKKTLLYSHQRAYI